MGNNITRTPVLSLLWYAIVVIGFVAIFASLTDIFADFFGRMRGVGIVLSRFLGVPIDLGIVAVLFATLVVLAGIVLFVVLWRPPGRLLGTDTG